MTGRKSQPASLQTTRVTMSTLRQRLAHLLLLANAVRPGLGLQIDLGVPVRVIHYDCVGCLQVEAQSASSRAEQEHAQAAVSVIELAHL